MNKQEKKTTIQNTALSLALLMMFFMALLPIIGKGTELWMKCVYAAGAAIAMVVRLTERYHGNSLRVKRLYRINKVSALLFCVSAGLLFYHQPATDPTALRVGNTDWIAFLMAGAVMQIYTGVALERIYRKEHASKPSGDKTTKSSTSGK